MTPTGPGEDVSPRPARWLLPVMLLLTAAIALAWGHFRLLDQDERFVLQTDSVPGVRALVGVQLHSPISLDPLFYHLLSQGCVRLFGSTAFAIRLPSLLGYLLMQVCLFRIGRLLANERVGFIAAAVPALTATLFYAVQARPYGMLLGLSALLLLSWLRAERRTGGSRMRWLVMLAVSLALALNTHYFAVLLLLPLFGAELVRTVTARRVDWAMVTSIAAGVAGLAFALPFQRAAGEFRRHYYNTGQVGLHAVTQAYRALIINYTGYGPGVQHAAMAALVLLTFGLAAGLSRARLRMAAAEKAWLLLLAALPFAGFLLARFVTHSIEVRYVLPAMVAIAVGTALACQPARWPARGWTAAVAALLLGIVLAGVVRVREEQQWRDARLASLAVPPAVRDWLLAHPGSMLYVQNLGAFEEDVPYLRDPSVQSRMALLYSSGQELRWLQHDTAALTAMHLQHFTSIPVVRYEDLQQRGGVHLLLLLHGGGWNWIDDALTADGAQTQAVARAWGGDVVAVRFAGSGR